MLKLFHRSKESKKVPLVYKPLSEETTEIRVLWLLPGSGTSPIEIMLEHVPLESAGQLQYEAISYAWGPPQDPRTINVKTTSSNVISTLLIRRNLYEALQQLRQKKGKRALWADAICINQDDLEERARQVEQMADIYKIAKQVVVWLGIADNAARIAMRLFHNIASNVVWGYHSQGIVRRAFAKEDHWANMELSLPFDDAERVAIKSFTSRPWFSRLWVWQEIARTKVVFTCGEYELSKGNMKLAVGTVIRKIKEPYDTVVRNQCIIINKLLKSSHRSTLQSYLDETSEAQCSDPRDRIYALRGLVLQSECIKDLTPDYTKSPISLYGDVVLKYLQSAGDLNLLSECGIGRQSLSGSTSRGPSWIPDLSIEAPAPCFYGERSCWMSTAHAAVSSDAQILKAKGVILAEVTHAESLMPTVRTGDDWKDVISLIIQRLCSSRIQGTYRNGQAMSEVLCRTLVMNKFENSRNPLMSTAPNILEAEKFLNLLCDSSPNSSHGKSAVSINQHNYLRYASIDMKQRTFFTGANGYVGLGPKSTRPGDEIRIILGCQTPLMLRPDAHGSHVVVGPCYVHGAMEAEAFLGPLPNGWRRALGYSKQRSDDWPVFVNEETGQLEPEDPRLGDLPPGWARETWDGDPYVRYVRKDGVKPLFPDKDPRMTYEALEARGVKIDDILIS